MAWLSRILGVLLLLLASALGIYALINWNDARRWDALGADYESGISLETAEEEAAWSRGEVRRWATASAGLAVPGLALLVLPSYLKRRRTSAVANND